MRTAARRRRPGRCAEPISGEAAEVAGSPRAGSERQGLERGRLSPAVG